MKSYVIKPTKAAMDGLEIKLDEFGNPIILRDQQCQMTLGELADIGDLTVTTD